MEELAQAQREYDLARTDTKAAIEVADACVTLQTIRLFTNTFNIYWYPDWANIP